MLARGSTIRNPLENAIAERPPRARPAQSTKQQSPACDSPFRQQVKELESKHNMVWESMLTGSGKVKYDNVAWPEMPCSQGENNKLMRHMLNSHKLKELRKRWHPDKFQQVLGKRVSVEDASRIFERVNDIFSTYLA